MSLKDSLNRFKQQQEKVQNTLTSITTRAAPSKAPSSQKKTLVTTTTAPAKTPTPPVKFSSDTQRLQNINRIKNAPISQQIKFVVDLLFKTRQALTAEEINDRCYVDINDNKAVFNSLKNNPKVSYDGSRFSYKATHALKGKDSLLKLIMKYPEGLPIVDVKDAYPSVMEDLQALKAAGKVWLLSNMDSKEDNVYPNDPRADIKVDDDLKQLFRSIELPRDFLDIEQDLQKNGYKTATNTAQRRAMAQDHGMPSSNSKKPKKKEKEITKRTKLTNAHLPELFQNQYF